jgi:uncharacterized protein (TIGR03083 family)
MINLFQALDQELIELLRALHEDDWMKPTLAKQWTVKDVAAHLLDGNIRIISMYRDHHFGEPPTGTSDYRGLVDFLNKLNADWVKAMKRVSPLVIVEMLEATGQAYVSCLGALKPNEKALFSVAWAGEAESQNWFHVAREYSEKWHHQQQIREAVSRPGIMSKAFFYPVIDTFMRGLPHAYRHVEAPEDTVVQVKIKNDEDTFRWAIARGKGQWNFTQSEKTDTSLLLPGFIAWKVFTKGMAPQEALKYAEVLGNPLWAQPVLNMVSVMA